MKLMAKMGSPPSGMVMPTNHAQGRVFHAKPRHRMLLHFVHRILSFIEPQGAHLVNTKGIWDIDIVILDIDMGYGLSICAAPWCPAAHTSCPGTRRGRSPAARRGRR